MLLMKKLSSLKKLLDEGLISQEDYDKAKQKLLGYKNARFE